MNRLSVLKSVFVFSELEEKYLLKIADLLMEANYRASEIIFRENDPADSFFIVDTGRVTISKQLGNEEEKVLAVLGPGHVFGEMAFFSDSPRTANAKVTVDSKLWEIKRIDFMRFVSDHPKAGLKITSGLLNVAMDRLEQTSRELTTIYHTGNIISSGKRMEEIASGIKDEILLAIPEADGGAIFLYNEYNDEFDPLAAPKEAKSISPQNRIVNVLKQNLSGILVGKCEDQNKISFLKECKSMLLAPILKEKHFLGFIILWNIKKENAFKGSHTLLVSSVGSQFAEAIENIKHQQEEKDRQRLNQAKLSFEK